MKSRRILIVLSILALAALFCSTSDLGLPQGMVGTLTAEVPVLQTKIASQLTQVALSPVVPSPAGVGSISGTLSYPADSLPAMRVAAFDTTSMQPYYVDTQLGQSEFRIPDVPAGKYYVIAYSLGGGSFPAGMTGAYTAAVPCGLTDSCTDHSLLPVGVETAQETTGIRPADWNGVSDNVLPPMPGPAPAAGGETAQPVDQSSISGKLSYPSSFIPPLTVVAFKVDDLSVFYYVQTVQDQATYSLELPAGTYYVVAYVTGGDYAGGYTQMVPCGLNASCTDHSLIPVSTGTGAAATNIDPGDWYGPQGAFPPNPVK
jgi:hypothetical protein